MAAGGGGAEDYDAGTWAVAGALDGVAVLRGVWAWSPEEAWVTAWAPYLEQWDGVSWKGVRTENPSGYCYSVWGYSAVDFFVGCTHGVWLKGPALTPVESSDQSRVLYGLHGLPDGGSIYAVGNESSIYRYDGFDFVKVDAGLEPAEPLSFNSVAVVAENDIWVAGLGGAIVHGDGASWTRVDAGVTQEIRRVWANGPHDVWFAGFGGLVLRWTGAEFERPSFCALCGDLYGAWGSAADDMWFGDSVGRLVHWDGQALGKSISPSNLSFVFGVGGVGQHDLFVSGELLNGQGTVIHFHR